MSIRIDLITDGPEPTVRIAGRLTATEIEQLRKVCDPIEPPFLIDLTNLKFADEEGVLIIRALADKGANIYGASPFVRYLLESVPE